MVPCAAPTRSVATPPRLHEQHVSRDLRVNAETYIPTTIFIDADACPVKPEVYRVAGRYDLSVVVVANSWMRVPAHPSIRLQVVADGFDAADDWIVDQVREDDIVITADIPLARRCLEPGAHVIGTTGKPFTADNIGGALATRDLLEDIRATGEFTGGPPPMQKRDRSRFLQQLDQTVQSIRRRHGRNTG